ncbi:VRR-NUC domain-containing protein [Larsenimonas rhizosphaerae]|uniref:VRR-NUC domain-containing protein n=1 Tax=Larsenimonas rhizosphaerae TaxID=2944682 RepID=UPI0020342B3E|nr:VRR-NUC domain-containing protein [Larsenimonas rhizosphaerae]MCM2129751.1 VRR-NUC domain-containing protein [Larsenimonas rhizosphaerae]
MSRPVLDDPHYYLRNFCFVLDWLTARYAPLLEGAEAAFITAFHDLPESARALLVRMAMRKGDHFRHHRLNYPEIGSTAAAVAPLIEEGLVVRNVALSLPEAAPLMSSADVSTLARREGVTGRSKGDRVEALIARCGMAPAPFDHWCASATTEPLYTLTCSEILLRLRLMFFGNLRQHWSEFVLAELGVYRFETVAFPEAARAFHCRADIDLYLALSTQREALDAGESPNALLPSVPEVAADNAWLTGRRDRLLYQLGLAAQRQQQTETALAAFEQSGDSEARMRRLRLLEKQDPQAAWVLADTAWAAPISEAEAQQLARLRPRLAKRLGHVLVPDAPPPATPSCTVTLPRSASVERAVAEAFTTPDAPVVYVENALFNTLFGLLCWDALFAPMPGAFFHPFHHGPADLFRPDFVHRRKALFDQALARLEDGRYMDWIARMRSEKAGLQSPFVVWGLSDQVLDLALACIPAAHLKLIFTRLLHDIKANRAGFPDLIQFEPAKQRYRMIEVKGPGDRLQDNQKRWLAVFARHDLPAEVCHVRWDDSDKGDP